MPIPYASLNVSREFRKKPLGRKPKQASRVSVRFPKVSGKGARDKERTYNNMMRYLRSGHPPLDAIVNVKERRVDWKRKKHPVLLTGGG